MSPLGQYLMSTLNNQSQAPAPGSTYQGPGGQGYVSALSPDGQYPMSRPQSEMQATDYANLFGAHGAGGNQAAIGNYGGGMAGAAKSAGAAGLLASL